MDLSLYLCCDACRAQQSIVCLSHIFFPSPPPPQDPMALQEAYSVVGVLMDNYDAFFTEIEKNRLRQAAIYNAQRQKDEEEERRKEEELLQILRKKVCLTI
jgi:hypothetical protein